MRLFIRQSRQRLSCTDALSSGAQQIPSTAAGGVQSLVPGLGKVSTCGLFAALRALTQSYQEQDSMPRAQDAASLLLERR